MQTPESFKHKLMRPKRKINTHLIEEKSLKILREILPEYWTIREYKPDYGLDLAIEFFEKVEDSLNRVFDTLGEHLFVQLKGVESIITSNLIIQKRNNIENEPLKESGFEKEIKMIKFTIDTNELATIHRMGNTLPVILIVVDIHLKRLFFICLNDYIEKILLANEPTFFETNQKTKTIYIPIANEITNEENSLIPLMFYAKRPKFYSAFNKIGFQKNELVYCDETVLIERSKHYAKILLRFDIWKNSAWSITNDFKAQLDNLLLNDEVRTNYLNGFEPNDKELKWEFGSSSKLFTEKQVLSFIDIHFLWGQMDNMKNIYESICREWFLPTPLG